MSKLITWATPKAVQLREKGETVSRMKSRHSASYCKKEKGKHVYAVGILRHRFQSFLCEGKTLIGYDTFCRSCRRRKYQSFYV